MNKQNEPEGYIGLDVTYCISSSCKNECGRKITEEIIDHIKIISAPHIWQSYFCGEE
jgi:hypothetical protein